MKTAVTIIIAFVSLGLFAEKFDKSPEAIAARKTKFIEKTGGFIEKPNTAKGKFVVFNAQKDIADEAIKPAIDYLKETFKITIETAPASEVTLATAVGIFEKSEANVAVFITDLGTTMPVLITCPDQKVAVINVAPLGDLRTSKNLCKEIVRGFAYISGAATSQAYPTLMSPFDNVKLMNGYPDWKLPADVAMRVRNGLTHIGIKPYKIGTYLTACKEGWAPAPKTDAQKAIWDEVRATPAAPLEIKFDPKSGNGKIIQKQ